MNCSESKIVMHAYLDGELDADASARYAEHLAVCADCAGELRQLQKLRAMITTHGMRHAAPPQLRQHIEASLNSAPAPQRKPARKRFSWAWMNFGFALASSLAFVVTLGLYLQAPSASERIAQEVLDSHFRSVLGNHLADVASSDQHTVKPWFAGKLDYSPPVQDFVAQGFALIGGRLDYVGARPVAALVYRHGLHVINLYVWPDQANNDAPLFSRQGYQMAHWSRNGMQFWAISDTNAAELGQFKRLLMAQAEQQK